MRTAVVAPRGNTKTSKRIKAACTAVDCCVHSGVVCTIGYVLVLFRWNPRGESCSTRRVSGWRRLNDDNIAISCSKRWRSRFTGACWLGDLVAGKSQRAVLVFAESAGATAALQVRAATAVWAHIPLWSRIEAIRVGADCTAVYVAYEAALLLMNAKHAR